MSWWDSDPVVEEAGSPQAFATQYGTAAARAGKALGVDPKVLLAQWGVETGWGKSIVPGTFNLGNIKDVSGSGVAARDNQTGSRDRYRKFASSDEFADAYVELVKNRYPGAMGAGADAGKFTAGLKGYAEDRGYGGKVAGAFRSLGDVVSKVIPSAQAETVPPATGEKWWQNDPVADQAPAAAGDKRKTPIQMASEKPGFDPKPFAKEAGRQVGLTARAGLTGFAGLPLLVADAPVNVANLARSVATGGEAQPWPNASQTFSKGLTELGLPEARGGLERVVQDVVSAVTGVGGQAKAAEGLSKVATSPVVKNALVGLSQGQGLQMASAGTAAAAGGGAREAGFGPVMQTLISLAGGAVPLAATTLSRIPSWNTRNAGKILNEALKDTTPAEMEEAKRLLQAGKDQGVPLMVPEVFPGNSPVQAVAANTMASPAGSKMSQFARDRAGQVEAAGKNKLATVGENVGGQEAANQAQEAADQVITNAQKFRTKAAGPYYQAERANTAEAQDLMRQIKDKQQRIEAGSRWKNDAIQQAGRWYAFSHEMGMKANEIASKALGWAGEKAQSRFIARAEEGKAATHEAVNAAADRQAYIDQWQKELLAAQDKLAEKNLPRISTTVSSFIKGLDEQIAIAGAGTPEGKILEAFKKELAPGGRALRYPSQLEGVYKATRDKLELGIQATAEERTAAGVLAPHVKKLDALIQDVSPAIREGRDIYAQLSKEFVDPLMKGPIGRIAGKGADAQKEATYGRVMSELQGDTATPERIRFIADQFAKVDKKAFPNMVRSYLEQKFDTALKDVQSGKNRMSGANFRNAVAGTPKERANLEAMVGKVAETQGQDAKAAVKGFNDMLDVFEATGRIPNIGSPTASRAEMNRAASQSHVADAAHVGKFVTGGAISQRIHDIVMRGTYRQLADIFTSPDGMKRLVEISKAKPGSNYQQALVANALGGALAKKDSKRPKDAEEGDSNWWQKDGQDAQPAR